MILKNTRKAVNEKIAKTRLKTKLKKQYGFSQKQIEEVFLIWSENIQGLKEKVKNIENTYKGACEYTEISREISSILYDALIKDKK